MYPLRTRIAGVILVALTAIVPLAGCSSDEVSLTSGPTATATPRPMSSLTAQQFAAAVKLPDTVILDVRTPEEFAGGHLEGAVNVDIESADFAAKIATLDQSKTYAVYCRSGNRSAAAVQQMVNVGFTSLYDLDGGITAWQNAGGAVVKS